MCLASFCPTTWGVNCYAGCSVLREINRLLGKRMEAYTDAVRQLDQSEIEVDASNYHARLERQNWIC